MTLNRAVCPKQTAERYLKMRIKRVENRNLKTLFLSLHGKLQTLAAHDERVAALDNFYLSLLAGNRNIFRLRLPRQLKSFVRKRTFSSIAYSRFTFFLTNNFTS
jgi:hypothetical protein